MQKPGDSIVVEMDGLGAVVTLDAIKDLSEDRAGVLPYGRKLHGSSPFEAIARGRRTRGGLRAG